MATFAPEVAPAVEEINQRFPALGKGGTYPGHGEDGAEFASDFWSTSRDVHDMVFAWLIKNASRLGVKYVISWERIWSVARQAEGIRPYRRDANRDGTLSASERHTNHVHISFDPLGEYMPTLADIRKVIREELRANNGPAADTLLERDGKIENHFTDNPDNKFVAIDTALSVLGERTKTVS